MRTVVLLGAPFIILCAISTFSYLAALERWPQAIAARIETWGPGPCST